VATTRVPPTRFARQERLQDKKGNGIRPRIDDDASVRCVQIVTVFVTIRTLPPLEAALLRPPSWSSALMLLHRPLSNHREFAECDPNCDATNASRSQLLRGAWAFAPSRPVNSAGKGLPRLGLDLGRRPLARFSRSSLRATNDLIGGPLIFEATKPAVSRHRGDADRAKEVGLKRSSRRLLRHPERSRGLPRAKSRAAQSRELACGCPRQMGPSTPPPFDCAQGRRCTRSVRDDEFAATCDRPLPAGNGRAASSQSQSGGRDPRFGGQHYCTGHDHLSQKPSPRVGGFENRPAQECKACPAPRLPLHLSVSDAPPAARLAPSALGFGPVSTSDPS